MFIIRLKYAASTILILLGCTSVNLLGQINIQSSPPVENMVEMIIGNGVQYSNVTYQGAEGARAIFENGNTTNLGLDHGIVLSSGDPNLIPGPNDECMVSQWYGLPGHPLLSELSFLGGSSDAAIIEFDIVPETDTLRFRYVFGSEDYSEWLIAFTVDVIGCFISGPSPVGGSYTDKNIAIIPGTENISVHCRNLNNGFAECGIIPTGPCKYCEYYVDNTNGLTIEYNGFTVVLEAWIEVIPCETYHVFWGIADGSDWWEFFDSGVFIEASSYQSPEMEVTVEPNPSDTTINIIEGCGDIDLVFKIPDIEYSPVFVLLDYSGSTANPSAYPDGDFEEAMPNEIIFEEGEDSVAIHISPVKDDIVEGDEILKVIVEYTLTCSPKYDTIEILISDYIDMTTETIPDTMICQGDEIELWIAVENGFPEYEFTWEGLPYSNDTILVSPEASTWYNVIVIDSCQETLSDSIYVAVETMPEVDLGVDTTICTGDEIVLQTLSGINDNYLWSTGDTTSSITVSDSGMYSLTVSNVCGEDFDEIIIEQWPYPDPDLGPDLELCYGETSFLEASFGFISYLWQDNSTESFYSVEDGGLYYVQVEDIHGCTGSDSVIVVMGSIVEFQDDSLSLCQGETVSIQADSGFTYYTWSTGQQGINHITVDQQGWYKVEVSYSFGCPSEDSVFVEELTIPEATITGENYLCEGDTIWLEAPQGKYDYYWNEVLINSYTYMVLDGGEYILTLTNVCGSDTDSKNIQLNYLPDVDLGEDQLLTPGEELTLDAGIFETYLWKNNPLYNQRYYTVNYDDINDQDSIWVEVFDGFCKNTDNIIIEVLRVSVPSVITPNGDGYNDRFEPISGWSGINNHTIKVFNRWGEVVWESNDFPFGWDGKRNDSYVSEGTYFWVLEVYYGSENIKRTYKGSLMVSGTGD